MWLFIWLALAALAFADGPPCDPGRADACGVCDGDGSACCGPDAACFGHGVCSEAARGCVCDVGWTGRFCDAPHDQCANEHCVHGRCLAIGSSEHCVCESGWTGPDCSAKECGPRRFHDHETGRCECRFPYTGGDCARCDEPEPGNARVCLVMGDTTFFPVDVKEKTARRLLRGAPFLGHAAVRPGADGLDCACQPVGARVARDVPHGGELVSRAVIVSSDEFANRFRVTTAGLFFLFVSLMATVACCVPWCLCIMVGRVQLTTKFI
jgi:hypothetical protein